MFHDASVRRFTVEHDELRIETEAFAFAPGETMPPALVVIAGLQRIFRNDVEIGAFEVESEDAEIYGLQASPEGVLLHLIWHFWNPKAPEVWCTYRFPAASLRVEALSGGPLLPVPASSVPE